ncbi:MAG TPA: hypothetical protein VGQ28_11055 [Thermoanaerobaculia bacterium]|jgi:hypothetical protein|nr:hypothetical protein [Thermoanaerobaculia bacterium]
MKMMSFTAPLLIVAMTVVAICGLGQLTLRASAVSTHNSIELLRMHLRVVRLHEDLLRQSQARLAAGLRVLPTARPKSAEGRVAVLPEAGQPWPEGLGGKP